MKILFYLSHPAHYHLFKNIINDLGKRHSIKVLLVKKDVLEELVEKENWDYLNIHPEGRRIEGLPILLSGGIMLAKAEYRLFKFLRKYRPDLMIGTEGTLAHMGKLFGIRCLLVNEDDSSVARSNYLFQPFSDKVIVPVTVDPGLWGKRRVAYEGYHELAYLHPKYFKPDRNVVLKFNPAGERYFIIRLALLTAHHDVGKKGIETDVLKNLIEFLKPRGKVFITSESKLQPEFDEHRLRLSVHEIHHALYYADLFLGDSQTMTMEAAVLGTPAFRFNSFADKCSVILELTDKYGLVFNFLPQQSEELVDKVKEVLSIENHKELWAKKRDKMLSEKIDVTQWMIGLIETELERIKVNNSK